MTSPAENSYEPIASFAQLWAESLSAVLGQIAGAPFPICLADDSAAEAAAEDVHLLVTTAGAIRGELSLLVSFESAILLAGVFLSEDKTGKTELTTDDRAALEELFRQVAGHVATSGRSIFPDLSLTVALSEAPTWSSASSGWFRSEPAVPKPIALQWKMSAALNAALLASVQARKADPPATLPDSSSANIGRLNFFMDLELDVTLRLGGRDLLLKDILDLVPGSVLELDRQVNDPADLLLDGKLIAKGEVVMVSGNYGLRVTEVFTSSQLGE